MNFPFIRISSITIVWIIFLLNGCSNKDSLDPAKRQFCNTASEKLIVATKVYNDSSAIKKTDTLFQNSNNDNYAKVLRNFIYINLENGCFYNRSSDSTNYFRSLKNVPGKCNQALLTVEISEREYLRTVKAPTDSTNCNTYSKSLSSYLSVPSAYNCLSASEKEKINQKIKSLKCICDFSLSELLKSDAQYRSSINATIKDEAQIKLNCTALTNSITSYLRIASINKCLNKTDSLTYNQKLLGLSCK